MNISCKGIIISAIASLFALPSFGDDVKPLHTVNPTIEKIKFAHSNKQRNDNMYFVRLKDKALASYDGSITGFPATSLKTNEYNQTAAGILNVKSQASIAYKGYLKSKQAQVIQRLGGQLNRTIKASQQYHIVVNALALKLSESEASQIMKDPDIVSVEKIGLHYIQTSTGPEFIGAKKVWQGINTFSSTKGEGVIVGVMDSGINASHPSFSALGDDGYSHTNSLGENKYLGDCIELPKFCNDKLIGIVSFPELIDFRMSQATDLNNPSYDDIEDKVKVGYDFNGHGSHVASTAAGNVVNNVSYYLQVTESEDSVIAEKGSYEFPSISGVAPHANIVSYQVCDDGGACYPEFTVKSLEHAIENGIHVLNYSVGGGASDPWTSVDAEAFLNAREAGIHVATSAGNAGPTASTIGSPGNAPWVTTVAAYTHNLSFDEKLLSGFSGGVTSLTELTGRGITKGYTGRVILAADYGDALCESEFAAGTFDAEIVVCERGEVARVRKGLNVKAGGAGGMILVNVSDEADSVNDDNHVLPAIHLDAENASQLFEWLESGEQHRATIAASVKSTNDALGDIAGPFTSRGPNLPYTNIFSPDIAAPGVDIYAANAEDRVFEGEIGHIPYAQLSGTSMASPHVAGALALLKATHPSWTPAQAQSAMMTTAHQVTYKDDNYDGEKQRSDFFDQGAGSLRIDKALKAGLLLDISKQEYIDADPSKGGDPSKLNTSSMVNNDCISNCTWTRTVTATQSGTWTASYEYLNPGFTLSVSPASFSLNAGESKELTITATANIELADEWVHGYVNLRNADNLVSDTHLQATIGFKAGVIKESVSGLLNNVDNQIIIEDVLTSGSNDLQVNGFGLYKANMFSGSAIGSSNDAERASPWSNQDVLYTVTAVVKPFTKRLVVEILESTSPDMDLFVGIDENNDGKADAVEAYYSLACVSAGEDSNERCVIETPISGNYWIIAHNFRGTVEDEADTVSLAVTQVEFNYAPSIDITAPTEVKQDELFDIDLKIKGYLDEQENTLQLQEGELYYGLIEVGTLSDLKRNVGATLVKVEGIASVNTAPQIVNQIQDIEIQQLPLESYQLTLPIGDVFIDEQEDELNLSVSGVEGIVVVDNTLTAMISNPGEYIISVTASDGDLSTSMQFKVVMLPNTAPYVVNAIADEKVTIASNGQAGLSVNLASVFSDDEGNALSYTVSGITNATVTGDVLDITFTQAGTYKALVTASDGELESSTEFTINVMHAAEESKSSSGSINLFGLFLLSLLSLIRLRRRA